MKTFRIWLHGSSIRWVIQQSSRTLLTGVLVIASTADSDRAFQWLSVFAAVCAALDSTCLWTGSPATGQRLRAAVHQAIEAEEATVGTKRCTTFIQGDFAYEKGHFEGFATAQLWLCMQLVAFAPLAITHKPSTLSVFIAIVCREAVSRSDFFAVPRRRCSDGRF